MRRWLAIMVGAMLLTMPLQAQEKEQDRPKDAENAWAAFLL
jgi:hypothetical protein